MRSEASFYNLSSPRTVRQKSLLLIGATDQTASQVAGSLPEARQPEHRVGSLFTQHDAGHSLAERRAVLIAVPRASSDKDYVLERRMAIEDEVMVRAVLVLADT